jgi:uncharacterized tellurite resistance protein B-like protein
MQQPIKMTDAHKIAFIYLYFAIESDQKLAPQEMLIISDKIEICLDDNMEIKLNAWDIVSESLNWIYSLTTESKDENYNRIMDEFNDQFSQKQKLCIIEDLKEIAKADGVVLEAEKKLIQKSVDKLKN